jgi:hypothetical protein
MAPVRIAAMVVGVAAAPHVPLEHCPAVQSLPVLQCLPLAQRGHTGPPQSTSVSLPSTTPSTMQVPPPPAHAPFMQVAPPGQAWLQPPQLSASPLVSTHTPLHSVPLQVLLTQRPARQGTPDGQALPQLPQLAGSLATTLHRPLHEI